MFEKKPKVISLETIGELCRPTIIKPEIRYESKKMPVPIVFETMSVPIKFEKTVEQIRDIKTIEPQVKILNEKSSEEEQRPKEDILWL
jgi:hypothetical protein